MRKALINFWAWQQQLLTLDFWQIPLLTLFVLLLALELAILLKFINYAVKL